MVSTNKLKHNIFANISTPIVSIAKRLVREQTLHMVSFEPANLKITVTLTREVTPTYLIRTD